MRALLRLSSLALVASLASGCSMLLPEVSTMPAVHNPFPQLSRVAVTPFFNLSDEPTVNGREFALAYFAELQAIPGFEVVPLGVVEEKIIDERINLSDPEDIRHLGQLLGVDAVVVGAVTDFSPYYPPRCGLRVEWYATNAGFHEIPAGYGLPWGTPEEEYIPQDVVFEAEMALARAQMETQSPICPAGDEPAILPPINARQMLPPPEPAVGAVPPADPSPSSPAAVVPPQVEPPPARPEQLPEPSAKVYEHPSDGFDIEDDDPLDPVTPPTGDETVWRPQHQATYKLPVVTSPASPADVQAAALGAGAIATDGVIAPGAENNFAAMLPPDWPDPRGFIPAGPCAVRPECVPNHGPVMTHTRIFLGHDPEFTAALAAYVDFRDDARFGGWRSYLERSDDFIRFCCHLHLSEMLSARGGASETRVVRHWSNDR